jgi:hypothetical protein
MSRITILNAVGVAGSLAAWAGGMGWHCLLVAGVFGWALCITHMWCKATRKGHGQLSSLRADLGDYLAGSFGWHLMILPAVGVGDWKLIALGIVVGLALPNLAIPQAAAIKLFYKKSLEATDRELEEYFDVLDLALDVEGGVDARRGYVALSLAAHELGLEPGDLAAFQLARPDGGLFVLSHADFPAGRVEASFELGAAALAGYRAIDDTIDQVFISVEDLSKHFKGLSKRMMNSWDVEVLLFLPDVRLLEDLPPECMDQWSQPLEDVLEALEGSLTPDGTAWLERQVKAKARKQARAAEAAAPPAPAPSASEQGLERAQQSPGDLAEPEVAESVMTGVLPTPETYRELCSSLQKLKPLCGFYFILDGFPETAHKPSYGFAGGRIPMTWVDFRNSNMSQLVEWSAVEGLTAADIDGDRTRQRAELRGCGHIWVAGENMVRSLIVGEEVISSRDGLAGDDRPCGWLPNLAWQCKENAHLEMPERESLRQYPTLESPQGGGLLGGRAPGAQPASACDPHARRHARPADCRARDQGGIQGPVHRS